MDLKLKFFNSYCSTKEFTINGKEADYTDFGDKYDQDSACAPNYGCGDMVFEPKEPTKEILKKYGITEDEYYKIADKLERGLSFGRCALCS